MEFAGVDGRSKVYEYEWDGKNDAGREVSSGIYIYLIKMTRSGEDEKEEIVRGRIAVIR